MKVIVFLIVSVAFLVVLKLAASLLVWGLHLLFAWGALVLVLAGFLYLAYCYYWRGK